MARWVETARERALLVLNASLSRDVWGREEGFVWEVEEEEEVVVGRY